MTKMTKIIGLVVGVVSLTIFTAAPASAQANPPQSSCSGFNTDVVYVGPCSVMLPTNTIEFTAPSSQVTELHWSDYQGGEVWGIPDVDHVTGPDVDGRYHIFISIQYAPVSKLSLVLNTVGNTGFNGGAKIDILGNTLSEPFTRVKPLEITAQRLKGGRCLVKTSLSFFAIKDFAYQVGLKLKGGKRQKAIRRVTSDTHRLSDATINTPWYQQWTFTRSLVLKKRQVKTLAHGAYKLRAFQSVSLMGSKNPSYSAGRTVKLRKVHCSGATVASL